MKKTTQQNHNHDGLTPYKCLVVIENSEDGGFHKVGETIWLEENGKRASIYLAREFIEPLKEQEA